MPAAQTTAEVQAAAWKRSSGMAQIPATSGTDARSGPKNLPRKTLATPQRWKKRMPRGSRSGWRRIGQIPKIAWP